MRFGRTFFLRPVVWAVAVFVAYPTGGGPTAQAQDTGSGADKKTAARVKLVDGDGFLKQGEYQQALAAFKEAYALYPSPKIHYDFGLAYQGMGRNADALEAFEAFLQGAPDAQPGVQARARASRDALLLRVGAVRVTADVSGANILVDGREIGKTPYLRDIRMDPGPHLLLVDRGGGAPPFTQRLDAVAGTLLSVVVRFPINGAASPATTPPPANTNPAVGQTVAVGGSAGATDTVTTTPGAQPASRAPWVRPAAWTSGGLAVAALAVGVVGWSIKESKYSAFNQNPLCNKASDNDGPSPCHDLLQSGDNAKALGIVGFVSAGVLGAVSAALFLWGRQSGAESAAPSNVSLSCGPVPGTYWGGLCGVRF